MPIVQTRVAGREFTVDLLIDRDGALAGAVPRWRLETKAGISTKGRTFADDGVVEVAGRALAAVGLCGAANLQGFVTDAGDVWVIEVNPRFSGGLSARRSRPAPTSSANCVRATRGETIRAASGSSSAPASR